MFLCKKKDEFEIKLKKLKDDYAVGAPQEIRIIEDKIEKNKAAIRDYLYSNEIVSFSENVINENRNRMNTAIPMEYRPADSEPEYWIPGAYGTVLDLEPEDRPQLKGLLGEFYDDDQILVVLRNGDFYLTNFDVNNHYEENILAIEKFDQGKVWTAVLFDADNQGYPYLKRFIMEATKRKQNFLGENTLSRLVLLTDQVYPRIKVTFGGHDDYRDPMEIDAEEFIAVKGFKAKGKRLTTCQVEKIEELEPTRFPEPEDEAEDDTDEAEETDNDTNNEEDHKTQQQVIDEITGQLSLFPDE
jgi:hypothetical protein